MANKVKIYDKIKLFLLFLYLTVFFIYGAHSNTIIYSEIILVLLMIIEIFQVIKLKKIKINPPIFLLIIFVIWGLLSSVWAIDPNLAIKRFPTMSLLTAFLILNYNTFIYNEKFVKSLFKVLMYAGLCFSLYVILYYGISNYVNMILQGTRIGGEINNVNEIGLTTSITFLIVLFMGSNYNKKYYVFLILPLLVTVGTGSRTAIIELLLEVIFSILFFNSNNNFTSRLKKVIVLIVGFLVIYKLLELLDLNFLKERFENMFNYSRGSGHVDNTTIVRMNFIKIGFTTFLENPLLGIGINNSGYLTTKIVAGYFTYLHNNYAELLATTGIIGFILYYYTYFYILKNCILNLKNNNKYVYLLLILCIVLLIGDFGTVSYPLKSTFVYFLCCFVAINYFKKKEDDIK